MIDIAHIFKNLPEFKRARESMKKQIEIAQQNFQAEIAALRILEARLAAAEYGSDTDELRTELAQRKLKLEIEKNSKQEQMKQSAVFEKTPRKGLSA